MLVTFKGLDGKDNPGLVWNLIYDLKASNETSIPFLLVTI